MIHPTKNIRTIKNKMEPMVRNVLNKTKWFFVLIELDKTPLSSQEQSTSSHTSMILSV